MRNLESIRAGLRPALIKKAAGGIRTLDLLHGKQTLYQLSYNRDPTTSIHNDTKLAYVCKVNKSLRLLLFGKF